MHGARVLPLTATLAAWAELTVGITMAARTARGTSNETSLRTQFSILHVADESVLGHISHSEAASYAPFPRSCFCGTDDMTFTGIQK
jgi:hypothetical protein